MADKTVYRLQTDGGKVVATNVVVAQNMWTRFLGLMGRSELPEGEGLCIKPCNQIHMFFMRIPLDVAFVDGAGVVLHVCHTIRPWRVSRMVGKSKAAIELPAGTLLRAGIEKGSTLTMVAADGA